HQTSEEPILPDGLFAFLSSGQRAGMSPWWRCAYRGYKSVARTKCAAPPPAKITPCSLHYLLSTQNKTPSWQSLRHNPLFPCPCPCAGDDRENRACEKNVNPITYKNITII
ncbi:hypothetical protein PO485_14775, partial [Klebsiella pneumoniae]|uniref:hypothetical protein n=1 Tax=Klebsiella pneumoniae TaxID=573 RepID=UPI001BDF8FAE